MSGSTESSFPRQRRSARASRGDDLVWLLEKAPAEVLILRPDQKTTGW